MMANKLFTVHEANRMLPALREVVSILKDQMDWLASNRPEISYLVKEFKIPCDAPVPAEYFGKLLQIRQALGKVESLGCQLKDIRMGLVDFPSRISGKDVLLCWHLGESSVEFYHEPRSGYSERRPLPVSGEGDLGGSGKIDDSGGDFH
jgi:hypothetical protein